MAEPAALELRGVVKRYPGVLALAGVDLCCRAGEVHAICGENGSGKSTLLGVASGSRAADAGSVRIAGEALVDPDPARARSLGLATVYQDTSLVAELSVADNLYLAARVALEGPARPAFSGRHAWASTLLARHGLEVPAQARVAELSPARRQFLEVIKALVGDPRVLLLDEPTAALGHDEVETLFELVRGARQRGVAVVYVSHRLPEVRALADRITILRDGHSQGVHDPRGLDDDGIISLMVGVPVGLEFPDKPAFSDIQGRPVALEVRGLSAPGLGPVDLELRSGEVLGIAGAEGNGQRELLRALAGVESARGQLRLDGQPLKGGGSARRLGQGLMLISGERREESIFAELGVRDNMTLQVLDRFSTAGLLSGRREREAAERWREELGIVTPDLDQEIQALSGGNQQKAVLARSFLVDARVLLVDEPTQGVDAAARLDIYRALRRQAARGRSLIVRSSDASELVGLCDRVVVMSRGRVTAELADAQLEEQRVVGAFLAARDQRGVHGGESRRELPMFLRTMLSGGSLPALLLGLLVLSIGAWTSLESDRFLSLLNLRFFLAALVPVALVAMAQLNVLLVGGFDVSVGALMSLCVVGASFWLGTGEAWLGVPMGVLALLLLGVSVGLVNSALVKGLSIPSIIATIATMSILQGVALTLRPVPGGSVRGDFAELVNARWEALPWAIVAVFVVAVLGDLWLNRSASGLALRATGYHPEAARRNGVASDAIQIRAYLLSALFASLAGLALAARVRVGSPTVGAEFALGSFAACVLGGASVWGGKGSFIGALGGAALLALTVNVLPFLQLNTAFGMILAGGLTLLAIMLYSVASRFTGARAG